MRKKPSTLQNRVSLRTRNPQLLRTVFFYAQDTLNSDLMRNYRFQGSLLGSPLGWPEKAIEMATFLIGNCEEFSSLRFSGILCTVCFRGSLSLKLLTLNSILLNLRVIPQNVRTDAPWDLHGFLRTSRLVLF